MFRPKRVTLKDGRTALIRQARAQNAEAVIAHVNTIGAETIYIMTERLLKTPREERLVFRQADGESGLYLVAVIDGEIVGSANIVRGRQSKNRHTAGLGIALRRDECGVGLGLAMMKAMIAWARSVGIRNLTLGVFATNKAAIALYRKLGFTQEGRLRGQVVLNGTPADEILMALWL